MAMGRTDDLDVRYGAAVALLFNLLMVAVAIVAIMMTVPKSPAAPPTGRRAVRLPTRSWRGDPR
jgi:hypothetical protein